MSTDQKRVVVIGGSSGIGAAIAKKYSTAACEVLATGATPAEVTAAQAREKGSNIGYAVLDVRDDFAVRALLEGQEKIDVLVNCAGIVKRGEEHDLATFSSVIDINLTGTMRTCAAARAHLK